MVDKIEQSTINPFFTITTETNIDTLLEEIQETLTSKHFYSLVAPLSRSNAASLARRYFKNRFITGGKAEGGPAWTPNAPGTLAWESEQPEHAPDYTLPLVFTGRARSSLVSSGFGRLIAVEGFAQVLHPMGEEETLVDNYGYTIQVVFNFPKYMVYHQYGYTTTWRGKKREVPARPWFLWASVNFDGAGFNLFKKIARRIVLDHASTLFAFIKRRLGGKLMAISGGKIKNA